MTRRERAKKQKQKAFVIGAAVGLVVGVLVVVGATFARALDDLHYCEYEGWSECKLEYDGLAYGWHIYYK